MAQTFSWTTSAGYWSYGDASTTLIMSSTTSNTTITANTGATTYYTFPSFQVRTLVSNTGLPEYYVNTNKRYEVYFLEVNPWPTTSYVSASSYATMPAITCSCNTSSLFSATKNPTSTTATKQIMASNGLGVTCQSYYDGADWGIGTWPTSNVVLCTVTFTLDAPPNINVSAVSGGTDDANGVRHYWKDRSSNYCNIYKSWAYYGGTISEGTLTVGEQSSTVTGITSGSKQAKIMLDTVGTFTPTITVTDSRGQVSTKQLNSITVEEYVEPTASWGTVQSDTGNRFFINQSTATVTISNIEVMTGFEPTQLMLSIGTQTVTKTLSQGEDSATMSILLNSAGTQQVSVRIRTTANLYSYYYYDDIVVEDYSPPSINYQTNRATDSNSHSGIPEDEGEEALITATFDYIDSVDLYEPTVMITDQTEIPVSATITWYESWDATNGVSDPVNWSSYSPSSPVTLYGLITGYGSTTGFNTSYSYKIDITPKDEISDGITISQTIPNAYYTIDFQAGGREIAFGSPANDDLTNYPNGMFKCEMTTKFNDMTNQEIENFISSLTPQNVADYVVEQSTSGNFTYRKWKSGLAELWGTTTSANYNMTTSYGGTYYGTATVTIPTGIFTSVTAVSVNRANGGQGTVWTSPYGSYANVVSSGQITMYISNGTSYSNAPLSWSVMVYGKWN